MSFSDQITNEYFEWMYNYVCEGRAHKEISYRKLFMYLHDTEFTYSIERDENRAYDGICLRRRFAHTKPEEDYNYILDILDGPCSVLEMMIALSIRFEEEIMDNPLYGCRTQQWFWSMLKNMGLNLMTDAVYDKQYVEQAVDIMLNREYERNGRGGLFYIPNCRDDLRKFEIWTQLCWFSNAFLSDF